MNWSIIDLKTADDSHKQEAAIVLHDSFKVNWPKAWPTLESAFEEVDYCLAEERICFAAVQSGKLLGWTGASSSYSGKVWELHPLCVSAEYRGQGVATSLVKKLESEIENLGGLTLYLGTDDESNLTSLGGKDLYMETWSQINNIINLGNHPYSWYERLGFKIVGVVPDANGLGKPDIMMAKRIHAKQFGDVS